eukprot:Skav234926  [mRNA]  locus=scaffold840:1012264:1012497:- [translate_table: standard]
MPYLAKITSGWALYQRSDLGGIDAKGHAEWSFKSFIKKVDDLFLNDATITLHSALSTSEVKVFHLLKHELVHIHFLD